ncbi:MAG: response regulator [Gammaproteobacteria bacterium]|nr:response regulator [Gammaproteobacteria bacterium]MYF57794.1 response regulator [Gammaproteobacteria bacterium]
MTAELTQQIEALRERISQLSAAILRISASLDLATVLQEVVDSARALTGASYGVIVTIDESGEPRDFVTSGFTPEEKRRFAEWSDGPRLYAHLRDLPGPKRLEDLPNYVHERGFSPDLMRSETIQSIPMRHGGEQVGNFFVAEKADATDFTDEDEELLMLFASQAATAIANARTYRDEQRARADLEALVETSPVGVVVLDAKTGQPVSFNQEARRLVEQLLPPGVAPEEAMKALTCRFPNGTELAMNELPLLRELGGARAMRAEEVVLSVPDGRSVAVLVNVTLNQSAQGDLESVVVTMQDLGPLEELDRQRSEFLSMVSHELRTPLAAIKGSSTIWLDASPSPDPAETDQFFRVIDEQADHMHKLISDLLDVGRIEAGMLSVSPVPTELTTMVEQARNAFSSGGGTHAILIDIPRDLARVLADGRRMAQVLGNLFSNAARHSPGFTPIRVAAWRDGMQVTVSVSDEGRGVSPEKLPQLFRKYARGNDQDAPRGQRGAGLGLVICKGLIEAHGGRIWAESGGTDQGARFSFTLPVAEEETIAAGDGRSAPGASGGAGRRVPILVVDDDVRALRFAREALTRAGYYPVVTGEHREIPRIVRTEKPRLVLLDLMLPDTDGIELMRTVPELADLPVIFISAYGRDETIAKALERGAVDYLVKPFSATELTARIRAALRTHTEPETFTLGDLTVRYAQRRVTLAGEELRLTAGEYELLRILSANAGRCVNYDALIRQMWQEPGAGDPDRVRTFVKQLRRKLGDDPARPRYILNERGVGYRMAAP